METTKIQIAIVDDDNLIVELLREYLDMQMDIAVQFTANSGEQCLLELNSNDYNSIDIIIIDLKMAHMDGVALANYVKTNHPKIKIIVVSSHYQNSFLGFMVKSGASAFFPKGILPKELVHAIREVYKSGIFFYPDQIDILRRQISSRVSVPNFSSETEKLTNREIDILRSICHQKTAKEIADELCISQRTVEGYKNNLFAKTGAKNLAGLVLYAIQSEVIRLDELGV